MAIICTSIIPKQIPLIFYDFPIFGAYGFLYTKCMINIYVCILGRIIIVRWECSASKRITCFSHFDNQDISQFLRADVTWQSCSVIHSSSSNFSSNCFCHFSLQFVLPFSRLRLVRYLCIHLCYCATSRESSVNGSVWIKIFSFKIFLK